MCDTVERFKKIKDVKFIGYKVVRKTRGKHFLSPFRKCQYHIGKEKIGKDIAYELFGFELYNGIHVFKNKSAAIAYAKSFYKNGYVVIKCACRGLCGLGRSFTEHRSYKSYTVKFCTPIKVVWRSKKKTA